MTDDGLRQRKKRRTRELIAAAAADLFAEHGYEQVTMLAIAAAADVSEQTIYNHFPTKQALVLDREKDLRDTLTTLIAGRGPGVSPAAAIREVALGMVDELAAVEATRIRGGLGCLSTHSPTMHRLALEMTNRHAEAIVDALGHTDAGPDRQIAKVHAIALAWVFQTISDESGRGTAAGLTPAEIAHDLRPTVAAILDDLDT